MIFYIVGYINKLANDNLSDVCESRLYKFQYYIYF